ncbi:MAG: hypothetical protein ABIW79_07380 [Gemmatimonas sp.]
MTSQSPYGPATPKIRHFLVRLAALDAAARAAVAARFETVATSRDFEAAEGALANAIARSGRGDERDALAGPLLQLARRGGDVLPPDGIAQPPELDPIAEPALAALLALLVADLISVHHFETLYAAFDDVIPRATFVA